jgi:hypothetical protein
MKKLKDFVEFVNEASIHGGTKEGGDNYQSPEENKKIATNIINAIHPALNNSGFKVNVDMSGNDQNPNLNKILESTDKLALITTNFSIGWDGKNRAGGIHVYVNKNNLDSLRETIKNIDHPFVRMEQRAWMINTTATVPCLIIYDDGVENTVSTTETTTVQPTTTTQQTTTVAPTTTTQQTTVAPTV